MPNKLYLNISFSGEGIGNPLQYSCLCSSWRGMAPAQRLLHSWRTADSLPRLHPRPRVRRTCRSLWPQSSALLAPVTVHPAAQPAWPWQPRAAAPWVLHLLWVEELMPLCCPRGPSPVAHITVRGGCCSGEWCPRAQRPQEQSLCRPFAPSACPVALPPACPAGR